MCTVLVGNERSGLKGRVEVTSHPQWRLKVDAVISGPSFGAGHEDQGSDHASDERADQLDASSRDHRDHGSEHAAVAKTVDQGRLCRPAGSADPAAERETDRHRSRGESLETIP